MKSLRAVTLAELIISTVLVSMVIAGVFSAENALRRTNRALSEDTQLSFDTRALVEVVRADARQMNGDMGVPDDTQVETRSPFYLNKGTKTFCFRRDTLALQTPGIHSDDEWVCYTQIVTSVYRCVLSLGNSLPGATTKCTAANTFVGSLVSDQFTLAAIVDPTIYKVSSTGDHYLEMTLVTRRDPTANAAVSGSVLTTGTAANPQMVTTFRENVAGF